MSVTDETEFTIWQTFGSPCFLLVTHTRQPSDSGAVILQRASSSDVRTSRVRIDSLSLRALSPLDLAYLAEKTLKRGVLEAPRAFGRAWAAANCSRGESVVACARAASRHTEADRKGVRRDADSGTGSDQLLECARAARWQALMAIFARVDASAARKPKLRAQRGTARDRHH